MISDTELNIRFEERRSPGAAADGIEIGTGDAVIALRHPPQLVLADEAREVVEALAAGQALDRVDDDIGRRGAVLAARSGWSTATAAPRKP